MTIALKLDFDQLKRLVSQCNTRQKIELLQELEKETFRTRFKGMLKNLKTVDLTLEEITAEVEAVRQKRYEG